MRRLIVGLGVTVLGLGQTAEVQAQVRVVGEHLVSDYVEYLQDPAWQYTTASQIVGIVRAGQVEWSRAQLDSLTAVVMEIAPQLDRTNRRDRSTARNLLSFLMVAAGDGASVGRFEHFRMFFEEVDIIASSYVVQQMRLVADDPRAVSFLIRLAEGRHEKSRGNSLVAIRAMSALAASEAGRTELRRMSVERTVPDPDAQRYLRRLEANNFRALDTGGVG